MHLKKALIMLLLLVILPFNIYAYSDYIYAGGETVGIRVNSNGVLVVGTYSLDKKNKINLQVGDVIISINGENVENDYEKLMKFIDESDSEINLKVRRANEEIDVNVTPKEYSQYYLGVVFKVADKKFSTRLYYAWFETGNFALSLVDNVKSIFTKGVSVNQMMGPIGISKTVASTNGFFEFVYIMALISLSLGITNLLPFPALDGGKIVLLLIEAIRRKPLKESFEIWIQMIGFSLLILLSVYISYIDVLRFF